MGLDVEGRFTEGQIRAGSVAWPSSCLLASSLPERGGSGLHSAAQGSRRKHLEFGTE